MENYILLEPAANKYLNLKYEINPSLNKITTELGR